MTEQIPLLSRLHHFPYIFCIDGGGSKTVMQVINGEGKLLPLKQNGQVVEAVRSGAANISTLSKDIVSKSLKDLFHHVTVDGTEISTIFSNCAVIGGFAGGEHPEKRESLLSIFEDIGIPRENAFIRNDAELALELVGNAGAILVSGTGSICYGRNGNETKRVGGLGRYLGDEGSGHFLGMQAVKAALEEEFVWGEHTTLTLALQQHFQMESLGPLASTINSGKMAAFDVAVLAAHVFHHAQRGDLVARRIASEGAHHLSKLLASLLTQLKISQCNVYLVGGIFKIPYSEQFIETIRQSPEVSSLDDPLLINVSDTYIATQSTMEILRRNQNPRFCGLSSLPHSPSTLSEDSLKKVHCGQLSTEQSHSQTSQLHKVFQKSSIEGFALLHDIDKQVTAKLASFLEEHFVGLSKKVQKTIRKGGRIFLVGAGSSGRVAVSLARKWREHWKNDKYSNAVIPIISGGGRAFVRPREGDEDSIEKGKEALANFKPCSDDLSILISASGSAKFHLGVALVAHAHGCETWIFQNTPELPEHTQAIVQEYQVLPLVLDLGPQAITGSTRLQAANSAQLFLGLLLDATISDYEDPLKRALDVLRNYEKSIDSLPQHFDDLKRILDTTVEIFSSKSANFFRQSDETEEGYVTYISGDDTLTEILIDTAETAPTFSLNPPRTIEEKEKKKAEYRTYLLGESSNKETWANLIGPYLPINTQKDSNDLLLSQNAIGFGSYLDRPKGTGNFAIGVFTGKPKKVLETEIEAIKTIRGRTAIISINKTQNLDIIHDIIHLDIQDIYEDPLKLIPSLVLKQTLNYLSNGAMILMGKVHGNIMVDLSPSNDKLIDRAVRIVKEIYSENHPGEALLDDELVFQAISRAFHYKKEHEKYHNTSYPSPVKTVLAMLENRCGVQEAFRKCV
ncbi:MAG: N-acetylglucosamine kinase-like BadF-type ATPase [Chlamydiales bacterium]|jgi:N-acetylglucosamine kinase-like BadF-type ATPase/N-acetylmuramic acid 6-phosphate (MurNAc-6-P) etherase